MLRFSNRALLALVTVTFIAASGLPAAARPVGGGFHGGGFHGGMGHPEIHQMGRPNMGPGPARVPGHPEFHPNFNGPRGNGPNGAGWHGGPHGPGPYHGPPPRGGPPHGPGPYHGHPPPPRPYHGYPPPYRGGGWGPYYGPVYGPYGPGWGWNGYGWAPLATFGAGALIGGGVRAAIASDNNSSSADPTINPKHYQWCEDHYKSYRASDNTYQPYNGPRKQCLSPYY